MRKHSTTMASPSRGEVMMFYVSRKRRDIDTTSHQHIPRLPLFRGLFLHHQAGTIDTESGQSRVFTAASGIRVRA